MVCTLRDMRCVTCRRSAFYGLEISPSERKAIQALAVTHIPSEKDSRSVQVKTFSRVFFVFFILEVTLVSRTSTTIYTALVSVAWCASPAGNQRMLMCSCWRVFAARSFPSPLLIIPFSPVEFVVVQVLLRNAIKTSHFLAR